MNFTSYTDKNKLAMDTILQKETKGIPTSFINLMQHDYLERIAKVSEGDYAKNPVEVYIKAQRNIGVNVLDQYIPTNPLSMEDSGYGEDTEHGATTGASEIFCDGILIDSPEAVAEHLESVVFERIKQSIYGFDEEKRIDEIIKYELDIQKSIGDDILKTGYGTVLFPTLSYYEYGYENYFMAYALYPEIIEKHFSLQADFAVLNNKAVAKAYEKAKMPPLYRLDHDMADSRGTLVDVKSLDKIWFPQFSRAIEPMLKTNIKMIWHCDGNLMDMVPRLLDVGVSGFQGFQYEDGMDYKKICSMKTKNGDDLIIWAGVSVTRTLPFGTPQDVKNELKFLVDNGPKTGLFLGASSSVAPGIAWENIEMMLEGFNYYRTHGRG